MSARAPAAKRHSRSRRRRNDPPPPSALRLGDYFERWVQRRATEVGPNTIRNYHNTYNRYVNDELRATPVPEITPLMISEYYAHLVRAGGLRGKPLSAGTVRTLHGVLHKALEDALRDGLIAANPATRARLPKYDKLTRGDFKVRMWNLEQVAQFLDRADADEYATIWHAAVLTGLSRAELLGLRWQDVDLKRRQLRVSMALIADPPGPPVLRQGRRRPRVVALGRDATALFASLKAQTAQRQRANAGPADALDLVFAAGTGGLIHPDRVTDGFRRLVREADLPAIRFHDLRSTQTAVLLRAGVPFHLVVQRLGHGDPWRAMQNFGHLIPPIDGEAAELFERLIGG